MDINIVGSITQLGYGLACTNLIASLDKLGHRVSFFNCSNNQITPHPKHTEVVKRALTNALNPSFDAPCIRIWHQFDMTLFCGKRKIGFPFFELDEFNDREKSHLSSLDDIIVTSQWAKNVIESNGVTVPVHIVPLAVDRDTFQYVGNTYSNDRPYRFFISGKWEYRKGHDVALKAFNEAFTEDDNVQLICLTQNPNFKPEMNDDWNKTFKMSKLGSKIEILPRVSTQEDVAKIMQSVDCGIFMSRGEGWNLEAIEMLATGKPIIATDYSAHSEFCNESNSFLIPKHEMEVAFDGHYFTSNIGNWMKITDNNFQMLVNYMKDMVDKAAPSGESYHVENCGLDSRKIYESINDFTWDNSAKKLVEILEN